MHHQNQAAGAGLERQSPALRPDNESLTLPLATRGDISAIASVMTAAFTLDRGFTAMSVGDRVRFALTYPAMLLSGYMGVRARQFYFERTVALQIDNLQTHRRSTTLLRETGFVLVITIGIGLIAFACSLAGVPASWLAVLGVGVIALISLVLGALVASIVVMRINGRSRRQERRSAGWTTSKKRQRGALTAPPIKPRWKVSFLAADPRVKGTQALLRAHETLQLVVPSGDIIWTEAATPTLARLYMRAGFRQWHPTSLALWKENP